MRSVGVNIQGASRLAIEHKRHTQQRNQSLAARNFHVLVSAGGLNIFNLERFLAPHHHAQQTFFDVQPRFCHVSVAGSMARLQIEPLPRLIQQQERAHLRIDQVRGFARDHFERVIHVDG